MKGQRFLRKTCSASSKYLCPANLCLVKNIPSAKDSCTLFLNEKFAQNTDSWVVNFCKMACFFSLPTKHY